MSLNTIIIMFLENFSVSSGRKKSTNYDVEYFCFYLFDLFTLFLAYLYNFAI